MADNRKRGRPQQWTWYNQRRHHAGFTEGEAAYYSSPIYGRNQEKRGWTQQRTKDQNAPESQVYPQRAARMRMTEGEGTYYGRKQEKRGWTQRRTKDQIVPDSQVYPKRAARVSETTKQPEDEEEDMEYFSCEEGDNEDWSAKEDIKPEATALLPGCSSDIGIDDVADDQETEVLKVYYGYLEELRQALGCLENEEPAGFYNQSADDLQETPALPRLTNPECTENGVEQCCSESTSVEAHNQAIASYKGNEETAVAVDRGGDESTKASAGTWIFGTVVKNLFGKILQRDGDREKEKRVEGGSEVRTQLNTLVKRKNCKAKKLETQLPENVIPEELARRNGAKEQVEPLEEGPDGLTQLGDKNCQARRLEVQLPENVIPDELSRRHGAKEQVEPLEEGPDVQKRPNIQLPIPENLRQHHWVKKSAWRLELSDTGYAYEGGITDEKMHGYGCLTLSNDSNVIRGHWEGNKLVDLTYCQLQFGQKTFNVVKRCEDYLLTIYQNRFVAAVAIATDQLDFNKSIDELKVAFFRNLTALEILQDEMKNKIQGPLYEFESLLVKFTSEQADPIIRANIFALLRKYSSDYRNLSDFIKERDAPIALKHTANILLASDSDYRSFIGSLVFLKGQITHLDMRKFFALVYKERIDKYREMLINACPSGLPSLTSIIQNLDDTKIVFTTRADIDVFDQLTNQPFFQHYKACVENLVDRFGQAIVRIPAARRPSTVIPIMSPLFEFLIKSLWEIITEIIEAADGCNYENMLKCESGYWRMKKTINWRKQENDFIQENGVLRLSERFGENSQNEFYLKSLEVQYKVLFKLSTFMFPKTNYWKGFNYTFWVLEQDSSQQKGGRKLEGWLQKGLQMMGNSRGVPDRFKNLSEGRLVWLYLLDHTIHEVLKHHPKYHGVLKQYDSLLQAQVRFIENSPTENLESFRVLTHNTVKFVTSSTPHIKVPSDQQGSADVTSNDVTVDVDILFLQISNASQNIENDPVAFSNFRDLITEYNKYLSLRNSIQIKAAPGHFSDELTQMMLTFISMVEASLKKSVPTTALVAYLRCLNDFLDDFRCIDFLSMWYIKSLGVDNQEAMEKVENKLSGKQCSYRVTNVEKFVADYECLHLPTPHHYIIQVVNALFVCLNECLGKQWQSPEHQLDLVQLEATGILLDAIRRSFMYLKEQPDYVDFEAFKKESIAPFARLVNECSTLNELKNRTNIVKESFWYLRKMDEIDIDQALTLLRNANTGSVSDQLLSCYDLYLSHYNKYIEEYTSAVARGLGHTVGLNSVKEMLRPAPHLHFSQWSKEFKTKEIPVLLAGLSAIWSILISKDLSSVGKFLKPHCIQILCILRLLGVAQSKGIDNHLAQVLTGQGKSVILGLLSTILAVTGHNVRVMCYSEYLSSRDEDDFEDFFRTFQIQQKIKYGTFEGMADGFLNPTCNGKQLSLRQMVQNTVLTHTNWTKVKSVGGGTKDTVLLIDEVDVFFTDTFYGNTYNTCTVVTFEEGLAAAQEEIWRLAQSGQHSAQEIVTLTKAFIGENAETPRFSDLNTFLKKPGTFSLLNDESGNLTVREYTNQSLFDEHLLRMTEIALTVATKPDRQRSHFIINSEGVVCIKKENPYDEGWCSNAFLSYYNTFNYFRLKESNYDHKNYQNYGYLIIDAGNISYARLPSQFPLILGVSGTLKNLGEYEKSGIKSYNIHNTTILPSFYGDSHLLFDELADFHYFMEEQDWLKNICNKASKIVQMSRAVLIFFESDLTMELFVKEYRTKFDRLNQITSNTVAHLRDAYIEESGLLGAVTLATRVMGRGVDYKSSLSVEKHGGVHVIQTFFSTDIKEEIQIKGRTARKDNKGSYEMVICKKHLIKEKVIYFTDTTAHSYATLNRFRENLSAEKGRTATEKIERSEHDHETTMKFFGLA